MTELLTAAQMRQVEGTAIENGAVTGLELMERAGEGVVAAIFETWPELDAPGAERADHRASTALGYLDKDEARGARRAVVLCGPGNNGGDGFVVARLLRARGWAVELFLFGDTERLPPDARMNCERWREMGDVRPFGELGAVAAGPDLMVDAVFGTGLTRRLPEAVIAGFASLYAKRGAARFVGVDSASGICMDSGRALGAAEDMPFARDLIVQFHRAKVGQYLLPEADRTGVLRIVDIGLTGDVPGAVVVAGPAGLTGKGGAGHKYSHGHALVLTGGFGRTGAARLAARAALRVGAGLVTLGAPGAAQMEVAAQITALMLRRISDGVALAEVLEDGRLNALCLGPGLGVERARDLVPVALGGGGVKPRPTVLDADALSAFADRPEALLELLHSGCVLTPHGGEFARLFPDIAARLDAAPTGGPAVSKVDATREAAARAGCVVLFKGPDTVIAAPDGRCLLHAATGPRAAPWLATAGSGDVLAGLITGLMARGMTPLEAAGGAAWLHVEAARSFGPGLIAEDLPEMLPGVFRDLGI